MVIVSYAFFLYILLVYLRICMTCHVEKEKSILKYSIIVYKHMQGKSMKTRRGSKTVKNKTRKNSMNKKKQNVNMKKGGKSMKLVKSKKFMKSKTLKGGVKRSRHNNNGHEPKRTKRNNVNMQNNGNNGDRLNRQRNNGPNNANTQNTTPSNNEQMVQLPQPPTQQPLPQPPALPGNPQPTQLTHRSTSLRQGTSSIDTALQTKTEIARSISNSIIAALEAGYPVSTPSENMQRIINALRDDFIIDGMAAHIYFNQRTVNPQIFASLLVQLLNNESNEEIYTPMIETFYRNQDIRDMETDNLKRFLKTLNDAPDEVLLQIEDEMQKHGAAQALVSMTKNNANTEKHSASSSGPSTQFSKEYQQIMAAIDELKEIQQRKGANVISDIKLTASHTKAYVERLKLIAQSFLDNLGLSVQTQLDDVNQNIHKIIEQISNSNSITEIQTHVIELERQIYDVPTETQVTRQSIFRKFDSGIRYLIRSVGTIAVLPVTSALGALRDGFEAANNQLAIEAMNDVSRKQTEKEEISFISNVLRAHDQYEEKTCIQLQILSLREQILLKPQSPTLRRGSSVNSSHNPDEELSRVIHSILTTELDISDLLEDLVYACTNTEPLIKITANIAYHNKLRSILNLETVSPLAFDPQVERDANKKMLYYIMARSRFGNQLKMLQIQFMSALDTFNLLSSPIATMPSNIQKIQDGLHSTLISIIQTINAPNFGSPSFKKYVRESILKNLLNILENKKRTLQISAPAIVRAEQVSADTVEPVIAQPTNTEGGQDILNRFLLRLRSILTTVVEVRTRGTRVSGTPAEDVPTAVATASSSQSSTSGAPVVMQPNITDAVNNNLVGVIIQNLIMVINNILEPSNDNDGAENGS
jgi:uncharacterized protein YbjQ (UPF0145 family)